MHVMRVSYIIMVHELGFCPSAPPGFQANYVSPSNANCNEDGITISCAVSPGERIELLCGVTGNPLPNVTSSVGSDNRIVFDRAMASDAGNYTCIASSDKFPQGNITRRFRLLVGGELMIAIGISAR